MFYDALVVFSEHYEKWPAHKVSEFGKSNKDMAFLGLLFCLFCTLWLRGVLIPCLKEAGKGSSTMFDAICSDMRYFLYLLKVSAFFG